MPTRLSHSTATQASNASTTERHTQQAQLMIAGTESRHCKCDLLVLTVPTPGWIEKGTRKVDWCTLLEEGSGGPTKACVLKAWCPDGRIRGYCGLPKGGSQLIVMNAGNWPLSVLNEFTEQTVCYRTCSHHNAWDSIWTQSNSHLILN